MNTIGENIAMFRKQKGYTQEALASAIGVSAQSISKWENNTNMPDIMLLPIMTAFVTCQKFFVESLVGSSVKG